MMFCKQMNRTYVMLALLRVRLINNIEMVQDYRLNRWKQFWSGIGEPRMLLKFNDNGDVST